jgi:hypothetical protein
LRPAAARGNLEKPSGCTPALDVRRKALGEDHPDVAESLNNLASTLAARGRPAEALKHMRAAAAVHDGMIGQVFALASEAERRTCQRA